MIAQQTLGGLPLGSVAQYGMWVSIVIASLGFWVKLKMIAVQREATILEVYGGELTKLRSRVGELTTELAACHSDCADKVEALRHELWASKADNLLNWSSFYISLPANVKTPEMDLLIARLERARQLTAETAKKKEPDNERNG